MNHNSHKRSNNSNEGSQVPFHKDINKYCKELSTENLGDPQNRWLDRICAEKSTLEDQIPLILLSLEAKPSFYGRLLEICRCLENVMKENFPGFPVEVRPFGSTATNLAFKNSDLDLFLDFDGNYPESLEKLPMTLKAMISKQHTVFKRVILIPAKVPIVRCEHHSGISCDISFSIALGVLNSELISFLLGIDDRLRPFFMILKFWLNKHDLIGSNGITSYSLILMAIYYLQQLEKPILPAIQYLQNSSQTRQIVGDWDASFAKDFTILFPIDNRQSILTLLKGFFEFYSVFEFGMYVICPFLGRKILKTLFYNDEGLPSDFELYLENCRKNPKNRFDQVRFMCVQDPFNHSHNVTRNVPKKVLLNFQDFCGKSSQICEEEISKMNKPDSRCEFFKELFKPMSGSPNKKRKRTKGFEIFMSRDLVLQDGMEYNEEVLRNLWCDSVLNYFLEILTRIMKCEVETFRKPFLNGCGGGNDEEEIRKFKCTTHYNLLQLKRRGTARQEFDFPKELSLLEKEEMISDYIVDEYLKNDEKLNLNFEIRCYLKKGPTRVLLQMETSEEIVARKTLLNDINYLLETVVSKWVATFFDTSASRLP